MNPLAGFTTLASGKVRDLYAPEGRDDLLLLVASDRVSAFDVVLDPAIPGKGALLTRLTRWWLQRFPELPNHLAPDAIAVVLSDEGTATLLKEAAAVQFVMDAFGHCKAIGASAEAKPLLDKAGVEPDGGVTDLGETFVAAAAKRFYEREPKVRTLA